MNIYLIFLFTFGPTFVQVSNSFSSHVYGIYVYSNDDDDDGDDDDYD
jgi:hypothetical protein